MLPQIIFLCGYAYTCLGVAGFILTGASHKTALIPAIFGIIFFFLGAMARQESRRRLSVLAAISVALIAFLSTFRSFEKIPSVIDRSAARPAAVVSQAINAFFSAVFIVVAAPNLPPSTVKKH
jgi:hypothetical protein